MAMLHLLILGGTAEARALATRLAARPGLDVTLSLAGRTRAPAPQAGRLRTGGFGGAEGLARYLRAEGVGILVDATHPVARRISANAATAAETAGVPRVVLCRPPWIAVPGDRWTRVVTLAEAAAALGPAPRRVFLAVGRQEIAAFQAAPQHRYLVRSIDPVAPADALPGADYLLARGPFAVADERRLLRERGIEVVVAKNSGGAATYGKIAAARGLGLPVILVDRVSPAGAVGTVAAAEARISHLAALAAKRGV